MVRPDVVVIPNTLHHIWVGDTMPGHLRDYVAGWRELHPEWMWCLWGDDDFGWLVNQDLFDAAPDIVGPEEVGQLRSDIARLEILHREGGVYVDCDMEAVKPLDPLLGVSCFAGFEDCDRKWVNNAIFGAEPGHPFLAALIEALPASVRAAQRAGIRRPNRFSGPQFVTPIWANRFRGQVTVHDSTLFYPYSWSELDRGGEQFPSAYSVHHWAHRRATHAPC